MEPQLAAEAAGTAQLPRPLAKGWCTSRPSTLHMVIEALQAQNEKKGTSVVAIKRFILAKYPTVDPIRLKYLLKQALSKGLSRGDLVRPRNSSAVGATGRFKLAPKKLQHKQPPGQEDPDGGPAPKPGQKGATKPPQAPAAGAVKEKPTAKKVKGVVTAGKEKPTVAEVKPTAAKEKPTVAKATAAKEKPTVAKATAAKEKVKEKMQNKATAVKEKAATAVKEKATAVRAKPADARPPAAAKPRSNGVKPPEVASHPSQGHSQPPMALAAEDAGGGDGDSLGGAGAKRPRKAPVGKSKGKAPKGVQQDAPKVKGVQGKARKPRAAPGAGQGEAGQQKAAPLAVGRKAP